MGIWSNLYEKFSNMLIKTIFVFPEIQIYFCGYFFNMLRRRPSTNFIVETLEIIEIDIYILDLQKKQLLHSFERLVFVFFIARGCSKMTSFHMRFRKNGRFWMEGRMGRMFVIKKKWNAVHIMSTILQSYMRTSWYVLDISHIVFMLVFISYIIPLTNLQIGMISYLKYKRTSRELKNYSVDFKED